MSRFSAPIAEQIWDMKYRFKEADGTPLDRTVEDTWRRIARSLADVEEDKAHWEDVFYAALEDFKFLPAGRITAGAGTQRSVTLNQQSMRGHRAQRQASHAQHTAQRVWCTMHNAQHTAHGTQNAEHSARHRGYSAQ